MSNKNQTQIEFEVSCFMHEVKENNELAEYLKRISTGIKTASAYEYDTIRRDD